MIGRAGRPQFDTEGKAVIMTSHQKKAKFETIASDALVIESQFHKNLIEHLNAGKSRYARM